MEVTEDLRELILVGASGLELRRKAIEEGMLTLRLTEMRGQGSAQRRHVVEISAALGGDLR